MSAVRRFLTLLFVVIALAAALWYGWRSWDMHGDVQTTEDAYVKGEILVLSPRVSGYAVAILADDNEKVAAKQVIVRIDPRDYRAAVQRAQASLDQANAALVQSNERLALQASQIEVAEAGLKAADAVTQNADIVLQRAKELLARGSGTQATFDQATAGDISAKASSAQAKAQLDYQRNQVGVLKADILVSEAKATDSKESLGTARLALEDTEVWAPLSGFIANRRTRVGEYVTVGTRMLSIVPTEGLWIEANFRETQLSRMKPDQPVSITVDTYRQLHLCGYVETIGQAAGSEFALVPPDNATGNFTKIVRRFPVRIRIARSDPNAGVLRPGMSTVVAVGVDGADVAGCHFSADKDRQPRAMPVLPAHPGLEGANLGEPLVVDRK